MVVNDNININHDKSLPMKLTFIVLDQVFDTGLTAMLDILATANDLADQGAGDPPFAVALVGVGESVRTGLGLTVQVRPFDAVPPTDWLVVPALAAKLPELLAPALERPDVAAARHEIIKWHDAGARIAAACTGTFIVAETGILDGGEATTTWSLSPFFRQRFPKIDLDETRLVKFSNGVATAGAMMGHVDLALWLVRVQSPDLAARVARLMLIDTRTSQAEYIIPDFLAHADPLIERFERWCRERLAQGFDLQAAADGLHVHVRTLQRRTAALLGKSPLAFFQDLRVEHVRRLLAQGLDLETIAAEVGYTDATVLRNLIRKKLGYGVNALRAGAVSRLR
jgi:transcriptional regulator GlxA family with amidase domain